MKAEEKISAISANARKIYITFLSAILFSAVTIMNTSDRQLVLNKTVELPILNLDVSLIVFFVFAPFFIIYIFFYLQLYLRRLKGLTDISWQNLDEEERRILIPWLIRALDVTQPEERMDKIQRIVINFSLWWTMPLVFGIFSFWVVKKHDPFYSYIVGMMPAVGTLIVLFFWYSYKKKANNDSKPKPNSESSFNKIFKYNLGKISLAFLVLVYEIVLLFHIIPQSKNIKTFCIDLSYQKLITEPITDYKEIYWANLNKVHLEGANLFSVCLKRANIQESFLQKADISHANLEGANLSNSNLKGANFVKTNLRESTFNEAKIQKAILTIANLQKANLKGAKLKGAFLNGANLQGALLTYADLREADLKGADFRWASFLGANLHEANFRKSILLDVRDLTVEQLSKAKTLYEAKLDPELEKRIKEEYPLQLEMPKKKDFAVIVSVLVCLSDASERLVEIIKGIFPFLNLENKVDTKEDRRKAILQLLRFVRE